MFDTITVIGAGGRAGSAIAGRLRERGIELLDEGGDLVLLCVPDAAIAYVAGSIEAGPWLAHVTVARLRGRLRAAPELPDLPAFSPSEAALYHSILRPSGASYEILDAVRLDD